MKTKNRSVVRLTESQLKQIVLGSVKNALNEMGTPRQNAFLQKLVGDNRYDNLSVKAASDKIAYLLDRPEEQFKKPKEPMSVFQLNAIKNILNEHLDDVDTSVVEFCITNSDKISMHLAGKVIKIFRKIIALKKKNDETLYNKFMPDLKATIGFLYKRAMKEVESENKKEIKETNMKTKNKNRNVVKLTESKLTQIVAESVKNILNESFDNNFKSIVDNALQRLKNGEDPQTVFDFFGGFKEGFARVGFEVSSSPSGYKSNIIDTAGNILSPNQWFDYVDNFHNGYAWVRLYGKYDEKYNFIDTEGNLLSPNQWFDTVWWFDGDGKARVKLNGKNYLIDKEGNLYDYDTERPLGTNVRGGQTNESKRRSNVVRLTESDLRFMVNRCIREVLYK